MKNNFINRSGLILSVLILTILINLKSNAQGISGQFTGLTPGVEYTYTIPSSPCQSFTWFPIGGTVQPGATLTSVKIKWDNNPQGTLGYQRFGNLNGTCDEFTNIQDPIAVTINYNNPNAIQNNTICCSQTSNYGFTPASIGQTAETVVSGGNGTFTYQWQSSTDGVEWTNISGATSPSYQPPALGSTTRYRRIVTSGSNSHNSPPVIMTISFVGPTSEREDCFYGEGNNTSADIYPHVCTHVKLYCSTHEVVLLGSSSTKTGCTNYQWQSSTDLINWSNISGATGRHYTAPAGITHVVYFRRIVHYQYAFLSCSAHSHDDISDYVKVRAFDEFATFGGTFSGRHQAKGYQQVSSQGRQTYSTVTSTGDLRVRSEGEILLLPGLTVQTGGVFIAEIGTLCQSGNWREGVSDQDVAIPVLAPETDKVQLYPNPTEGIFNLALDLASDKLTEIFIFNPVGQLVYTYDAGVVHRIIKEIDLKNKNTGIYIAKIKVGDDFIYRKIILTK